MFKDLFMPHRALWLSGLVLSFLLLAACGNKGPLFLPPEGQATAQPTPSPASNPDPSKDKKAK